MATTFKAQVYADGKRRDGTYNVKIRITHNRRSLKIATHLYAGRDDLTKGLALKNHDYIDQVDDIIRRWRGIVSKLGMAASSLDVKQIVDHIRRAERGEDTFKLDFIAYGRGVAEKKSPGTCRTYITALNCLDRYVGGRGVDVADITANFLRGFENFIRSSPARAVKGENTRATSFYMACIRHVHNMAKKEFNDDEVGAMNIPRSPFDRYTVGRPPVAKKRAVSPQTIQLIIDLPDYARMDGSPRGFIRRDLARDCFVMSFALAGMNAADFYDCPAQVLDPIEPVIVYRRKKTRDRRADGAEMHIRIEPCIAEVVKKYVDPTCERMFCFHRKFSSPDAFNDALRKGLKQVEAAIGCPDHLTFYAARHSYATISLSREVGVDKYTIHEGLNHVDPSMRVTDMYITRDFSNIWAANVKLLALFDWSKIQR